MQNASRQSELLNAHVSDFGFLFAAWGATKLIARFGGRWQVTGLSDSGSMALFCGLLMLWSFLSLPLSNSITRQRESEADMFGLNVSRQSLGLAEFMIRDADAFQLDPSPLVEPIFYSHPSARNRIFTAMRWRAENMVPQGR